MCEMHETTLTNDGVMQKPKKVPLTDVSANFDATSVRCAVHPRNMTATTVSLGSPELPKLLSLDEAQYGLARALVELVWAEGLIPQIFEIGHAGARWQVEVRMKQPEDK